jgi:nucleoside-diphosphate-sugar epimerase
MPKKLLITGVSGFVGYHLVSQAVSLGFEVFGAVRPNSEIGHLKEFNIQYRNLDYSNINALRNDIISNGYDFIIHAAGITKAKTLADYNQVNAVYSENLALAAIETKVEKFIFVSSLAAIGPVDNLSAVIGTNQSPKPVTSYGISKLNAELSLSKLTKLPLIVIRPTAVYGPREKDIFILFESLNKGLEPYIGNFDQKLSFIYVKDLAKVILRALDSSVTHKAYNISDGHTYDRFALANISKKVLKKKTLKFHIPLSIVRMMASMLDVIYKNSSKTPALNKEKLAELTAVNWICNIDSAKEELGFEPEFDLRTGLSETLNWYKENNWL